MSSKNGIAGSKRRRETEESWEEEERPRIRVKTENELSACYFDDDSSGPPTPPMPHHVKVEREDDVDSFEDVLASAATLPIGAEPIPSTSKQSGFSSGTNDSSSSKIGGGEKQGQQTLVNSKPTPINIQEKNNEDVEMPTINEGEGQVDGGNQNTGKNDGKRPGLSSFFNFTSTEQLCPVAPIAVNADIKPIHVVQPQIPHYYARKPEEELMYVNESGEKLDTIPIFKEDKNGGSDAESDISEGEEERDESRQNDGEKLTRYYLRNTVYEKYDFESKKVDATRLAVNDKKAHILNTLEKNRVLIIEGFTGCGKTTQVPQFILDKCREDKKFCNIVVTQPRKIAASSVAKRVCFERNWQLGSVVGYQVGMESKRDKDDTLLTFMTTGVLLQKLISQKSLKEFTHIIIDEVHERDLESDFLLLVIKRIMAADHSGKERHVKLILMSATIDTNKFENYFQFKTPNGVVQGPPVIKIPFIARHRIDEYYLDDILVNKTDMLNMIESNLDREKAAIHEDVYDIAVSVIIALDDIEKSSSFSNPDPRMRGKLDPEKKRGAVLVFLPGMEEIKTLQRALENKKRKMLEEFSRAADRGNEAIDPVEFRWVIYPLHSSVTAEDQSKVFENPGNTFRKIILSTNIAESSITVPDIEYVIDFCVTKSLCVDQTTNFGTLRMVWASKSQCVQRRGRAGRVADGKVYRLVPKSFYQHMEQNIVPEMQRSNLETVILMCKKFDLDCPRNLLRDALDPPKMSNLEKAVATLKELGALTIVKKEGNRDVYDTCDGDLTFLGRVMSALPIPQQCTRLILFGHCFGVMREAIIIAAGLSVKNPFQTGFQKQLDSYLEKMRHAKRSFSDLFALYHVYKYWICKFREGGQTNQSGEFRWARGAMVHLSALREIKSTVELLEERLKKLGIEDRDSYAIPTDANADPVELSSQQGIFLKLAIAGAFYPNYFLRRRPDLRQYEREMNREVNGNDVFRTVYFKGFPGDHKGQLYAKHVADYLACGLSIPTIRFDGQKVFAIFDNSIGDTIGPFSTGMFRALKLRQLRSETLEFRVLWKENEQQALNQWRHAIQRRRGIPCPSLYELPSVITKVVTVKVQHILSPSQFWVVVDRAFGKLQIIYDTIERHFTPIPLSPSMLCPNCLCLAPFENCYYRAKVLRTEFVGDRYNSKSLVYFVDYGNSQWVASSSLCDFTPGMIDKGIERIPCLAIECRLEKMKPNIVHGLHWSQESIDTMKKFCDRAPFTDFRIFSIYQSVMVGELIGYEDPAKKSQLCSLNRLLISNNEEGKIYAETASESYLSMENWRKRDRSRLMNEREVKAASDEQVGEPLDLDFIEPPRQNIKQPVTLKGPWSPLEMNFKALVKCSTLKNVKIDNNSVNSVLLDHEPTASNSRMLVASHIGVADKSQLVMIRDSTIMSAIPGILQLVCMIFGPKVEFRVDSNVTKYVGLICGCGTVPLNLDHPIPGEHIAVHPDNDMEIVFDTEIDDSDIDEVNAIRYHLNNILRNATGANKSEQHKRLRDSMIKLLRRSRNKLDEEIWPQEEHVWNRISEDHINSTVGQAMVFNHDDIFLPHPKVKLNRVESENLVWDGAY